MGKRPAPSTSIRSYKRLVSVGTNTDWKRGIEKDVSWKENQNKSEVAILISEKQ